jgi:DNA-binding response OmpR family regulator
VDTDRFNVLLVEDDLVQVDLARRAAVESCPDIELTAVASCNVVLDWFSTNGRKKARMPHIILLDLKLPKLDGLAVLRKLRSHAATSEIPVVVFSAEYTQSDVLMSYKAGANSFLAKPTDITGYSEFFRERLAYWMYPQQHKLFPSAKDGAAERI